MSRKRKIGDGMSDEHSNEPTQQWFLLPVRAKTEPRVAKALRAKGFEVFLPMRTVRRQYSDRLKVRDEALFAGMLFCKFAKPEKPLILSTADVLHVHHTADGIIPVPDVEVDRLRVITKFDCEREIGDSPVLGDPIEIIGSNSVRGILLEIGVACRVAICLNSIGRAVILRVPLEWIKMAETPATELGMPAGGNSEPHR